MIAERHIDYMYGLLQTVLAEIGPRESCSDNERRLGRYLSDQWSALGHQVRTESFLCHPKAFLGFIPIAALLYLAAAIFYWFSPWACVVFAAASLGLTVFELLRYRELIDPLFPEARGENVIGVIPPQGTAKRRVVVSAHQDSAYEFNLWFFLGTAAVPIMVVAFAAPLLPLLGGLIKALSGGSGGGADAVGYACAALYPVVGLNLFFHTYSVVPGAMDDLAGIAVLTGLARALSPLGDAGGAALRETEVVLLATSSEEAGLRGAKRFVAAHGDELRQVPTYGLFVDGVYDERFLTVVDRELTTGVRHHPGLVQLAREVAEHRGWEMRKHMVPLGATDATAFSADGIAAVCLLCQDVSRLVPNYHTRRDVIEHVRPQSLCVALQVVLDMTERIDAGVLG